MGTAWHENHTASPGFSRAGRGAPGAAGGAALYGTDDPISGRAASRESRPYGEKRTLPGTPADVSRFACVTALDPEGPISVARFGNIDPTPFQQGGAHVL